MFDNSESVTPVSSFRVNVPILDLYSIDVGNTISYKRIKPKLHIKLFNAIKPSSRSLVNESYDCVFKDFADAYLPNIVVIGIGSFTRTLTNPLSTLVVVARTLFAAILPRC